MGHVGRQNGQIRAGPCHCFWVDFHESPNFCLLGRFRRKGAKFRNAGHPVAKVEGIKRFGNRGGKRNYFLRILAERRMWRMAGNGKKYSGKNKRAANEENPVHKFFQK